MNKIFRQEKYKRISFGIEFLIAWPNFLPDIRLKMARYII